MAKPKTAAQKQIEHYLPQQPEPHQSTLRALRSMLQKILPDATEQMSFRIPAVLAIFVIR
jgi:uncharacterized protein YdhG (YjbR/CyaY superfamily)